MGKHHVPPGIERSVLGSNDVDREEVWRLHAELFWNRHEPAGDINGERYQ